MQSHCVEEITPSLELRQGLSMGWDEIIIKARGSSFLYRQVRNMVGTLVEVGRGALLPKDVKTVLEARQRSKNVGMCAPPHGLYLMDVIYPLDLKTPLHIE